MISVKQKNAVSNAKTSSALGMSSPLVPQLGASELLDFYRLLVTSGYAAALDSLPYMQSVMSQETHPRLDLLKGLFSKGESLPIKEAASSLAPLDIEMLISSGLLHRKDDRIKALFQVQVYSGFLFIVDFMPHEHPADLVLPIGPSGKYLASVTIRRPCKTALDLGCGCGVQSLLLARHVGKVTATDINPRAIALTRLNADLNSIPNIEILEGSYFEPVHGMTFDLIVANLPYVITPENKYIYRDISEGGDNSVRQTVQQVSSYLNEGGYAHLMLNWIHGEDQPWWQPVEEWIAGRDTDAWLLYTNSMAPEEYTGRWLLMSEKENPEEYARVKASWLDWYRDQHIERIAFGIVTLRRRTGRNNWRCSIYVNKTASEPLGDQILHLFENQDFLNKLDHPDELLKKKLRPWNLNLESLPTGHYLAYSSVGYILQLRIRPESAYVIAALDGKNKLKDIIQKTARDNHLPQSSFQDRVIKDFYQLINFGLIAPAH